MIDAVNNLLLETYHSYTGRARMSGSGDLKRLVIHFNSTTERDAYLSLQHDDLADLRFFLHDPQQLRTDEDLWAIQVTDILFFIKKDDITALFKKYGNIQSCRIHTRANAKVQQARIVYDDASSIQHFMDKQWAIYCYSTCLSNNTGRSNNNTNNTSSPNPSNSNKSIQSAQRPRSNERKGKDRLVSFSTFQRNNTSIPNSSGHKQPPLVDPNCSQIQEILSVLKSLQEDIASVHARIHALELADQRMSRLELRVFGHKQDDVLPPDPNNSSYMLVDNHQSTPPYITQSNPPTSNRFNSGPVLPPPTVSVPHSTISSSPIPETADEVTINKERAEIYSFQRSLDNKFDHLSGSIERFINSISDGSFSDLVNKTSSD
ncbi:hypothetical protein RirG_072570 [Rhizophagus irregularis DAOM 197198w]|uniref:RRM domain-containing protein n=1 Tax=Rhizophagus irregularis (strain DAOM 197198w) TaxID=1432141 RepID=A0A015JXM4_RHIIW|nr:hypothetical protein RirG_072570 [Rhizophagus irregularis DAOM 197198w]